MKLVDDGSAKAVVVARTVLGRLDLAAKWAIEAAGWVYQQ